MVYRWYHQCFSSLTYLASAGKCMLLSQFDINMPCIDTHVLLIKLSRCMIVGNACFDIVCSVSCCEGVLYSCLYTLSLLLYACMYCAVLYRCMLEVWQAFPGINITGTAKSGFLLRLATRFLILVYQVMHHYTSILALHHYC
jgi:hypothetical protein